MYVTEVRQLCRLSSRCLWGRWLSHDRKLIPRDEISWSASGSMLGSIQCMPRAVAVLRVKSLGIQVLGNNQVNENV